MKVLVMGGTRFMGIRVVDRLCHDGHNVTVFNRGSNQPSWGQPVGEVHGDRNDPCSLSLLVEHEFDAVVDLSAYTRGQTDLLLDVLGQIEVFVHCSTAAVYAPDQGRPLVEDKVGKNPLFGEYGIQKMGCEEALSLRRSPEKHTSVLRFPYVLGPENYIPREEFVLNRVLDNEIVFLPGDGQATQDFVYVDHAAEALCSCLNADTSPGWRALNIATPGCSSSLEEFVDVCAQEVGMEARIIAAGGGPSGDNSTAFDFLNCLFPFPNESCLLDLSAADRAGITPDPMSLEKMIGLAYEALIRAPARRIWLRTGREETAMRHWRLDSSMTPQS